MKDSFLTYLSLANKAGKVSFGEYRVELSIQSKHAKLLLLAADASTTTKKKFIQKAYYYSIPLYEGYSKEIFGYQLGKSVLSMVAIEDEGFAKGLIERAKNHTNVKLLEVDLCQE